jgi:GTP-binding protein HflX
VVDASHHDWEGQIRVVERVLAELELADRPLIPVFNKMDLVLDAAGFAARVRELYPGALTVSTMRTSGLAPLKAVLREMERAGRPTVRVRLPISDGARLAALYRDGEVLSRQEDGAALDVMVRLVRWQVDRLRGEGVEVIEGSGDGEVGRRAG